MPFKWNDQCQQAFEDLKKQLTEAPVLAYPDFSKEFILESDASTMGLGAVLAQQQHSGKNSSSCVCQPHFDASREEPWNYRARNVGSSLGF